MAKQSHVQDFIASDCAFWGVKYGQTRQATHRWYCGKDAQLFSSHTGDVSVQASEERD